MWITSLVLLIGAVVVFEVARRGRDGRLPLNPVAGMRTRTTMTDEETWRVAHEAGAQPTMAAAAISAVAAAGLLVLDLVGGDPVLGAILALVVVVGLLGGVLAGAVRAQRAAREVLERRGERR